MERFLYDSKAFQDELRNSQHHAGEVKFLQSVATRGMRVIEVGAHRGVTAIAIAKAIGNEGHLHAFEPVGEYYAKLQENIAHNGVDNINTYPLALSNRRGRIRFYKRGGGSGITPDEGAEMLWVEAITIADFLAEHKIGRIDLLNLDCEGSELFVLQGARALLSDQAPGVFCEIHHPYLRQLGHSAEDVVGFLRELDYDVRPIQAENLGAETSLEACSHVYAHRKRSSTSFLKEMEP